jgi:SAM-dependent methyltransferase
LVYSLVAATYRGLFIKPNLERVIAKHFAPGARLLHAGCGSGQIDSDIVKGMKVVALDISLAALRLYRMQTRGRAEVAHGDLFSLPLPDAGLDGVYSVGVMEHFAEPDVRRILLESKRVVRPGGKIVMFWPPEFGLSVLFFKALRLLVNGVLRRNVKFHPDEPCRLRSRAHAQRLLREAGLSLVDYAFGPRDLFIQAVVVAQKPL